MQRFVVLEKAVGETPLVCQENYRSARPELGGVSLAYAGRLDPMASGKLLVLIGEECKKQEEYFALDKEYEFEILLGTKSDTGDVLGLISDGRHINTPSTYQIESVLTALTGEIELPYPTFSSKTVAGKPLHQWTLEGALDTITIPTKISQLYALELIETRTADKNEIYEYVTEKIETIPTVTEASKALGADFRRTEVRQSWRDWQLAADERYTILKIRCACSSGTYMRTLAQKIGEALGSTGLAYSIHRTRIGRYENGVWKREFAATTLYFDGICNLCNRFVRFIKARKNSDQIEIVPIQHSIFKNHNNQYDSVILTIGEHRYEKSEAIRQLLLLFGGGWSMVAALLYIIPHTIRDWGYDRLAKNRYRLFGTHTLE